MTGYGDTPRQSKNLLEFRIQNSIYFACAGTEQVPVVSVEYFQQPLLPTPLAAALSVLKVDRMSSSPIAWFAQDPAASGETEGGTFFPLKDASNPLV